MHPAESTAYQIYFAISIEHRSYGVRNGIGGSCETNLKSTTFPREFMQRHGHRCYKEFDLMSNPWITDPEKLARLVSQGARYFG